jgi:hypothetical protein
MPSRCIHTSPIPGPPWKLNADAGGATYARPPIEASDTRLVAVPSGPAILAASTGATSLRSRAR